MDLDLTVLKCSAHSCYVCLCFLVSVTSMCFSHDFNTTGLGSPNKQPQLVRHLCFVTDILWYCCQCCADGRVRYAAGNILAKLGCCRVLKKCCRDLVTPLAIFMNLLNLK